MVTRNDARFVGGPSFCLNLGPCDHGSLFGNLSASASSMYDWFGQMVTRYCYITCRSWTCCSAHLVCMFLELECRSKFIFAKLLAIPMERRETELWGWRSSTKKSWTQVKGWPKYGCGRGQWCFSNFLHKFTVDFRYKFNMIQRIRD